MARIPDDELARIKRETYLVAQAQAQAGEVELRRHGPNLIGRCLWHDDQTARLIITPGKNLWRCMGACQVGGSASDWRCALDEIPARPQPAQRVRRRGPQPRRRRVGRPPRACARRHTAARQAAAIPKDEPRARRAPGVHRGRIVMARAARLGTKLHEALNGDGIMQLRVLLEPSEDGGYTVSVPSLPGCISEGDTREDALANIREAVQLYFEPVEDDTAGRDTAELVEIAV